MLPDSPSVVTLEASRADFSAVTSRRRKSDDYAFSILAAKSLKMALLFLCNLSASQSTATMSLNPAMLRKAIRHCVLTSRVIEEYFGFMLKGDNSMTANGAADVRDIVRDALMVLGPCYGKSAERLLSFALMKRHFISRELMSAGASRAFATTK